MELEGAFKTDAAVVFSLSRSVTLSITMILPGSNIPVRIRGIEFVLTDQAMEEVLLGRPFLKAIGFNLQRHLETVRDDIHDKDIAELEYGSAKIATAACKGLAYQAADDDPIELPEALTAGIGKDTPESINSAFSNILKTGKENGISDAGHARIGKMLETHPDAFRIKLGPDPPAKVEPLAITQVEVARPFRSPQRHYAPHQRDFIIRTIRELESVGAIY